MLVTAAGCSVTYDATTLGVPATLSTQAGQHPAGARFEVTTHAVFGLWGLFKLKRPSIQKVLATELAGGKSISDIRIRARTRWTDLLVTVLTAGLVVPRSVTVEGVVAE